MNVPPRWKRSDLSDRMQNHLFAEAIYERDVHGVTQVIERVRIRGSETNAYERASYRLLEVRDGKPLIVGLSETLRQARATSDRRAS